MAVRWSEKAKQDLAQTNLFYLQSVGKYEARRKLAAITQELKKLAENAMLDSRLNERGLDCRYSYVVKFTYKVYYYRLGPRTIQVLRLRSTRSKPLKPEDIL